MAGTLPTGTRIPTMRGGEVRIVGYLGGGGQGDVYEVIYNERERKALKWYRAGLFTNVNAFVSNLKHNVMTGSPEESFLWPQDITDYYCGTFGYVMDLRPKGFADVDDILLNNNPFPSFKRAIDACMRVISAFCVLHGAGYSYQDINLGNFFINPQTGKVLVCDNDNVAPNGTEMGIVGTLGFMAPEVLLGGFPNAASDRFSLAVFVFMLLFRVHPLEGRRVAGAVLDEQMKRRIYGSEPLFVFDPHDHSNALDPNNPAHVGPISIWNAMPEHFRRFMCAAFSQECLRNPPKRQQETSWLSELVRLRTEAIVCPNCQSEVFFGGGRLSCDTCRIPLNPRLVIDLSRAMGVRKGHEYQIPVVPDARLYKNQVQICGYQEALDPVAQVIRSRTDPTMLGIRNMSRERWECRDSTGKRYDLEPGQVDVLREGLAFKIGGSILRVCLFGK